MTKRQGNDSGKRYWNKEQIIRNLIADGLVRENRSSETSAALAPNMEVR